MRSGPAPARVGHLGFLTTLAPFGPALHRLLVSAAGWLTHFRVLIHSDSVALAKLNHFPRRLQARGGLVGLRNEFKPALVLLDFSEFRQAIFFTNIGIRLSRSKLLSSTHQLIQESAPPEYLEELVLSTLPSGRLHNGIYLRVRPSSPRAS